MFLSLQNKASFVKDVIVKKRMFQNYPNDIVAGNVTRTPIYAVLDNVLVGVSDQQALNSMWHSLEYSLYGWSLFYAAGNGLLGSSEFYNRPAKLFGIDLRTTQGKIAENIYSGLMTFIFGMGVNLSAGYDLVDSFLASGLRTGASFFLGNYTRRDTDGLREMRNEPPLGNPTSFHGKPLSYTLPRALARVAIPLSLAAGVLFITPDKKKTESIQQYLLPEKAQHFKEPASLTSSTSQLEIMLS